MYEDALTAAKELQTAVDAFLADPTDATLAAARDAWKAARVPYMQTEGFRFGNAIVDDWEGKVNAWPLDEGLIDYVDADLYGEESEENPLYTANVIANPELRIGADVVDATTITPELSAASCRRRRASRRTSPPAITRSSSCSGARTSTAPGRAPASGPRPTIRRPPARTRTATGAAPI